MAITYAFYADPALTTPLDRPLAVYLSTLAGDARDMVIYLGSHAVGHVLQAESDPGVDPVTVSIYSSAAGVPASAVRLALSAAGLDTAIPGLPLSLGVQIPSDVIVEIHVRVTQGSVAPGEYANLSIIMPALVEYQP